MTDLAGLRAGGKPAMAQALNRIERRRRDPAVIALLDAACADPRGHILGLTGPPGVGKSTLVDALIRTEREAGRTVGVIAVDPSSRRSGGALLGDRTRLSVGGEGVFVRSMAARGRLGGLAALTFPAAMLMRAVYDTVIIETVGVGQSETEIANIADMVTFCIQPGSGDAIQFIKAGVMETPDIALVTKSDLGPLARRAAADVRAALALAAGGACDHAPRVMQISAAEGTGVAEFLTAAHAHVASQHETEALTAARLRRAALWIEDEISENFGAYGLRYARANPRDPARPFSSEQHIFNMLRACWEDRL